MSTRSTPRPEGDDSRTAGTRDPGRWSQAPSSTGTGRSGGSWWRSGPFLLSIVSSPLVSARPSFGCASPSDCPLPAPGLEEVGLLQLGGLDAGHGVAEPL